MKAYHVRDEKREEDYCTVVFAETRGNAVEQAMYTDACADARFTDIRAIRCPGLDKYYRGVSEMDWNDYNDRVALVKEAGFYCSYEVFAPECGACPAKEWCDRAKEEADHD